MIGELNEYIQKLIKDITDFLKKYRSPIAITIASIFILMIVIAIIVIIIFQRRKSQLSSIDKKTSLSANLTKQVIDWVENYDTKNLFLNERYDRFIRNVCLKSDLYKKLFDNNITQEDKDSILYHDMKLIERDFGFSNIRSNYPLLHKEIGMTKDELYSYISQYVKKEYNEAEIFLLKIKKMNHFRYTDIERFFEKYDTDRTIKIFEQGDSSEAIKVAPDYEFFFAQIRALDSNFNQSIQYPEKKEETAEKHNKNFLSYGVNKINKIIKNESKTNKNQKQNLFDKQSNNESSVELISHALEKKIISKDKLQGVVNNFYRKSYAIVEKLGERILQWASGENKRFCEGENCDHYEQIFSSLIFKIAAQNYDSRLIDFIDEFKKQHQENPTKKLSEFLKSKFDLQEIKKIELVEFVINFVVANVEEAYYFDILLNEQTKLTAMQNSTKKFSVAQINNTNQSIDKSIKTRINTFVENTFNNSNH